MTNYDREPDMPGVFTYSSGDCREHGVNVPFAASRGGSGPKLCVACMLVELQRCAPPETVERPKPGTLTQREAEQIVRATVGLPGF